MERTGLRRTDQRLKELFENLKAEYQVEQSAHPRTNVGSVETLRLTRETFKRVITDNIVLIATALRKQFVIPEFQSFCGKIDKLFFKCGQVKGGCNAEYIPQLARVNPNYWGNFLYYFTVQFVALSLVTKNMQLMCPVRRFCLHG